MREFYDRAPESRQATTANAHFAAPLRFERLISKLSAKFINLPFDQIDNEIKHGLKPSTLRSRLQKLGIRKP